MMSHKNCPLRSLALALSLVGCMQSAAAQVETQVLLPQATVAHRGFGLGVAMEGHWLAIAAPATDIAPYADGVVYMFERVAGQWVQRQEIFAENQTASGSFGSSIDLSGNWMVVASWNEVDYSAGTGVVRMYERVGTQWLFRTRVNPSPFSYLNSSYGRDVALDGDVLAIGAPNSQVFNYLAPGAVYVARRSGSSWAVEQVLNGTHQQEFLGSHLSISGDRIAASIAAPGSGPVTGPGARVYKHTVGSGWSAEETFNNPQALSWDAARVCLDGMQLACSYTTSTGAVPFAGSVDLYELQGPQWGLIQSVFAPDGADTGMILTVELQGERLVFGDFNAHGAPGESVGFGALYVFERRGQGWDFMSKLASPSSVSGDYLGGGLALDGATILGGAATNFPIGPGRAFSFDFPLGARSYGQCTQGPCSNSSLLAGCTNSIGSAAHLVAGGSTSVAADSLYMAAQGLPSNQFGLIYMGAGQTLTAFGDGQRLVIGGAAGVWRFPVQNAGPQGVLNQGPNLVAQAQVSFGPSGQITAGQTWHFQAWYRDPTGPCGAGFNLSQGLSITFQP